MDAHSKQNGSNTSPLNIYHYDDFRIFLKDSFEARKTSDHKYSYRKFAQEAELSNPGYLLDVIIGKRTLSDTAFDKMVKVFQLDDAATEFLRLLVDFGQCKKEIKRQEIYQDILYRRNRSRLARINPKLVKYYQDFHYPLVRCAIDAFDFRGDYTSFGNVFDPPIAPLALKKFVRDLSEWDLIRQGPNGHYTVTESFVEPPATMASLVRRLNREWILQAADAPFKFPKEDRHISTMLLMVSEETRRIVKEKLESFRQEVLKMVEADKASAVGIMQLSLQYFPKTKKRK